MTNAKALDERRLFRALRDQGFEVTPNGEAVKMTAPDGEPLHFHRSTFTGEHGTDANRSYRNALGELRRHGFDPEAEPSRGGTPEQVQQQREQLDEQIADESAEHAEAEAAAAARERRGRRAARAPRCPHAETARPVRCDRRAARLSTARLRRRDSDAGRARQDLGTR